MPLIEMTNLAKSYETGTMSVQALSAINLSIEPNEYLAMMGPSGSGKSTMMSILGCLDTPTSGQYLLENQDITTLNDNHLSEIRNKKIGFVFQSFHLLPRATALDNVELPLIYSGLSPKKRKAMAMTSLERVGLSDRMSHKPSELSGGQRQRVAIARALVNEPSLILADEPTGNLDSKTGSEIMALITALHAQGNTVIMVTHEADIAAQAQRIVKLRDGQIESDLPTQQKK